MNIDPQILIMVLGSSGIVILVTALLIRARDSVKAISSDLKSIQSRFDKLQASEQRKVDRGLQEIDDLEQHVIRTKDRIMAKNIEREKVISAAQAGTNSMLIVLKSLENTCS